jgi:hypothetical protein
MNAPRSAASVRGTTSPICGNPPPVSWFSHRRAGFRRSFTVPPLSRGTARPSHPSTDSSPAAVRSRTPLIDFCNRYDLRAQPRTTDTPHDLASSRPLAQPMSWPRPFDRDPDLRMATSLSRRSQPRCHGPGALPEAAAPMLRHPSPQSLTVKASPQPDRLGHLLSLSMSVVRLEDLNRSRLSWSRRMDSPSVAPVAPRLVGPPPAILREEGRVPLHPRCLPSPERAGEGSAVLPQAVPSLWSNGLRLFRSLHSPTR